MVLSTYLVVILIFGTLFFWLISLESSLTFLPIFLCVLVLFALDSLHLYELWVENPWNPLGKMLQLYALLIFDQVLESYLNMTFQKFSAEGDTMRALAEFRYMTRRSDMPLCALRTVFFSKRRKNSSLCAEHAA